MAIDYVGMDVCVEFGDSRSNGSRDIPGADCMSNERTNMTEVYPNSARRLIGVSPPINA